MNELNIMAVIMATIPRIGFLKYVIINMGAIMHRCNRADKNQVEPLHYVS